MGIFIHRFLNWYLTKYTLISIGSNLPHYIHVEPLEVGFPAPLKYLTALVTCGIIEVG